MTIKQFFADVFNLLPDYKTKYAALAPYGPIRDVKLTGEGVNFCFLDFWTEELAATALWLDKIEYYGRLLKIGRPSGYDLSIFTIPPPLDVSVLRQQGILPADSTCSETRKSRQIYVGNLPPGKISEQLLRDLFEPACRKLLTNSHSSVTPIVNVELHDDGRYAFVEFVSESLANATLGVFGNNTEIMGRRIFLGRPQAGLATGDSSHKSVSNLRALLQPNPSLRNRL